ncbi:MAG: hypothetical protein ACK5MK_09925 [Dysgonomonas sp.]
MKKRGYEIELTSSNSIKSFNALYRATDYAEIDKELVILFLNTESRSLLKEILIQFYFPLSVQQKANTYYLDSITKDILNESGVAYRKKLEKISKSMNEDEYQEEFFF